MKVLALDYGSARTGVAVSDPTGTLARPLCVVTKAASEKGLAYIAGLVAEHAPDVVVVGLPLTLRGERGPQAKESERFAAALQERVAPPVETYDERFTTALAGRAPGPAIGGGGGRGASRPGEDARAAAHLLEGYLQWAAGRT